MADAAEGSTRDGSGEQTREDGPDENRTGVVEELKRIRLLVQQDGELDKEEELLEAAREGRLEVVRFMMEECSADVNIQDNSGVTALMWAASGGHVDIVRYLVEECSANVNIQDNSGVTALMLAADGGHVDIVRCLVEDGGVDVNIQDNSGVTALMLAARGRVDVVCYLVAESSADVNIQDNNGWTALMRAAWYGHVDVVRYLVGECSADVNMKDNAGWTALMLAAHGGDMDAVRFMVNEGGGDVNATNNYGRTALMWAASGAREDVVRFLVEECSADVRNKDNIGWTALMWATSAGHVNVVRFLVEECGSDVNMKNNAGWTVLMLAANAGDLDVVRFLVEKCSADVSTQEEDGRTALMWAASDGHIDVVRFLVEECGSDVRIKDNDGRTALVWAASKGHTAVVSFLVNEGGADVNIQDNDGETALMLVVRGGRTDIVRFLVEECGSDVNVKDNAGWTVLMLAASDGHMDDVRFLVEKCSADVSTQEEDGRTALMWAASDGHIDVVRFLVEECGSDVRIKDNDGRTALVWAASKGHTAVVSFLVNEGGADVNIQDNDGETALMLVVRGGHTDIVRFLVNDGGADVNIEDNAGWTALMRAASDGHMDVVRFLVEKCSADVNTQEEDGWTALMWAANNSHIDVVRYLVNDGGADVNMQTEDGLTVLMKAVARDQIHVVRFLVKEAGAGVHVRNEVPTALRIASDYGHNDIVRLLTPFAQSDHQRATGNTWLTSGTSRSISIPASEVRLGEFDEERNIGGDFRVKWLGADAVVKLFISDASGSTFEQELRTWQELRHPNVLKLYGVCQAAPSVNFFVCEYASQGSLAEYTMSSPSSGNLKPLTWKFLYEAALGLEYLHERGIIHGDLRCSNILIGNDGIAKLSNFGTADVVNHPRSVIRSMRWQAPEVIKCDPPSRESDVYSLGMCIVEATSGKRPWSTGNDEYTRYYKLYWNADAQASAPYNEYDGKNPCGGDFFVRREDPYFVLRSRELVWRMCSKDPHERSSLTSIISDLEQLAIQEGSDVPQPKADSASCFEGYMGEDIEERWQKLHECMDDSGNAQYCRSFDQLKRVCDLLQVSEQSQRLLDRFYSLVTDLYRIVKMTPEEAWAMQLSSTRATATSMISFGRRIDALLKALGESVPEENEEISMQKQRREQGTTFVSGFADTVILLQSLKSVEEKAALLNSLGSEMENPEDKYTEEQLRTMKKTYEAIESKLATEGVEDVATLTPKWFIPWWELILDEREPLGAGGFGSVRRAKWLDSDIVVKQVLLPGSARTDSSDSLYDSLYAAMDQKPTDPDIAVKRAESQAMFRREADIWFGFSHPHVVRLFGACHIGRPFFVCEYATHGTLDSYLRNHHDDLWTKLHEAALGVQYLHARDVVHGDLKGNNVVVGSDLKAKVTDFGLSLAVDSEVSAPISGAWHWVAPECLVAKKGEQTGVKPTFESDVYSLGMCIVEALLVVEAVQNGKPSSLCLPWGMLDNPVVKYHVTRGKMPSRPSICTDEQWNLVTRMCVFDPKKRIKISTVVDELERFVRTSTDTKTNNQVDHVADDISTKKDPVNQESVVSMTAAARERLSQLRGNTNQQDDSPVVLYDSMWNRIERVREQIDEGDHEAACKSAFHSLVVEARMSTANLLEARTEDLISLARAVMGCYALSRRLDKLCDAYFLRSPRELEFPEA